MKFACLAVPAFAAALVGLVFIPARPASGQAPSAQPPATSAVQAAPGGRGDWYFHAYPDSEHNKLLAEEGRLEREVGGLVEEYARTEDEAQRAKTKAKLAASLEKQFELQQKRRDSEVARIEAQLKKLREIMRKRGEGRQAIIDRRLDQLLREADGLGWTLPPGTGVPRGANYPRPDNVYRP